MSETHVWMPVEITLTAARDYANAYTEVEVWVDLTGPDFSERCRGFWDGDKTFRVRVTAMTPGEWRWTSGSNQDDDGLNKQQGAFTAIEWTEAEKEANACRRGFIRATPNGHAFQYADGSPYFLVGDTWWPVGTARYRWHDDDLPRPIGPGMGIKDAIRYRKAQGYNAVAMIAAFPSWEYDGRPKAFKTDDGTLLRMAWPHGNTKFAKSMRDEDGNRPFFFPGPIPGHEDIFPDFDRINPAYFQNLDRKVDYLNSQAFIVFMEVARRDTGPAWQRFYDWPDSYVRYAQYIRARYQAHNMLFSPIHFDTTGGTIPADDWNECANLVIERYGEPPFGILSGTNAAGSTLHNFGHVDKAKWLTFHQTGNKREHRYYPWLTEIFDTEPPVPCFNGEPCYDGFKPQQAVGGTELAALYCRSGMYGSFLSGGLAGHIYGAQGLWGGDIEKGASACIWDGIKWDSGAQMTHFAAFVRSEGRRYEDLLPSVDHVEPNQSGDPDGYLGWAFCARTEERDLFMLYFEREALRATVSGLRSDAIYRAQWFSPRTGEWLSIGDLTADETGCIELPNFPGDDETADEDWALKLVVCVSACPGV